MQVIKKNGNKETFQLEKIAKNLDWAIEYIENKAIASYCKYEILKEINNKIYNGITTDEILDTLIDIAISKVSRLYPEFDRIANLLFIQKWRKEFGLKRGEYISLSYSLNKSIQNKSINKNVINSYSNKDIEYLNKHIDGDRDYLIKTYLGIKNFKNKYAFNKSELPQHTFMRVVMIIYNKYKGKDKLKKIIKKYNQISQFYYTKATPYYNANEMFASCVLTEVGDNRSSILYTNRNIGNYSSAGGGLAIDVSAISAIGHKLNGGGKSSGKIPFIKMFEATLKAFNQKGKRSGAGCFYFNWWDYEVENLIMLKDEGGVDDERLRLPSAQIAVKINRIFIDRILNDEYVTLFDAGDVPKLLNIYGKEFEKLYKKYEQDENIRKKKIKARELIKEIVKQRIETGNIYIFFIENTNEKDAIDTFKEMIKMSNLCMEIVLPTNPPKILDENIIDLDNKIIDNKRSGLISLCNLSSINLAKYLELGEDEKYDMFYTLLESHLLNIEYGYYPSKEGEIGNKLYRPIGIGTSNLAYVLAKNNFEYRANEETLKFIFDLYEDIAYNIYKVSNELAKVYSKFKKYDECKYKDGWLVIDTDKEIWNKYANDYQKNRWEDLRKEVIKYGLAFYKHMAIAPTATSSLFINATEGVEPIIDIIQTKVNDATYKQIAPQARELGSKYTLAKDIPTKDIIKIRRVIQLFLDQAQSINFYTANPDSIGDEVINIINAERAGLKTLYYLNTLETKEICESCQS